MQSTLKAPLLDIAETSRISTWRGKYSEADIALARETGMTAPDIALLRTHSAGHFCIIVRCPNRKGLVLQGVLPPKPAGIYDKKSSAISGTLQLDDGRMVVSDYDLMSVWQGHAGGWKRVFCPGPTAKGGYWGSPEAERMMRHLLPRMDSPFDHGCQDDFHSKKNPGVGPSQRFVAFLNGTGKYLPSRAALVEFHQKHGLEFPYDGDGKYTGPVK